VNTRVVAPLLLAAAALLAACDGGYPDEDAPRFEPHRMDNAERLAALNEVGGREGTEGRWRYALEDDCRLHAEQRSSGWGRWRGERLALNQLQPRLSAATDDDETHRVELVGSDEAAALVFETSDRIDALQVELLLVLLRRDCGEPAATR
jgi:hypothetical protein